MGHKRVITMKKYIPLMQCEFYSGATRHGSRLSLNSISSETSERATHKANFKVNRPLTRIGTKKPNPQNPLKKLETPTKKVGFWFFLLKKIFFYCESP